MISRRSAILRLYGILISASLRSRMQYKFDFIGSSLIQALMGTYDYFLALLVIWRFKSIAGWDIYEVGLLYSVSRIGFGLYRVFLEEVDQFETYIASGEFDSILVRPYPSLFVLMARNFAANGLPFLIQGLAIMAISVRALMASGRLAWAGVAHLVLACLWTLGLLSAVGIATSAAAFVIVRIEELQVFTQNATETATLYPLDIYPRWLKFLLLGVIPLAVGNYVPVRYILGKGGTWLSLVLPGVVTAVSLAVALRLWRLGESRYHSTGS